MVVGVFRGPYAPSRRRSSLLGNLAPILHRSHHCCHRTATAFLLRCSHPSTHSSQSGRESVMSKKAAAWPNPDSEL